MNSFHCKVVYQKPWRVLLTDSLEAPIYLTFLYSSGNGAAHSGLGPLSLMKKQGSLSQTCPQANLNWEISHLSPV